MATIYSKPELLQLISHAVDDGGWKIIYLNQTHPFEVKIFNDTESHLVKIIIYNITHGGGTKRADNEYRIQLKIPKLEQEAGYKTLILGYYDVLEVFAGWDIRKHLGDVGYSASFQIREDNLEVASISGFSPCDKGNGEIAIAFSPDFFVEYVRNLEELHDFGKSARDLEILAEVTENEIAVNDEIVNQVTAKRRDTIQTISKKQRDSSFKNRILRAYNNRCAFSGTQLRLVDAAHIVPVAEDGSTDETSNGIALSKLHHKAYDKGLITFNQKYQVVYNENEVTKLKELSLDGGWEKFLKDLRPIIDVPPAITDRPNVKYVARANKLRGWK